MRQALLLVAVGLVADGCFVPCSSNVDCNRGEACEVESGRCVLAPDSGSALTAYTGATPIVVYSLPSDGTYGVPAVMPITVVFSQPMNAITMTNLTFVVRLDDGTNVDGTRTADVAMPMWRFTPVLGYPTQRRVDVTITTGATSLGGVPLALDHKFSFISISQ